MTITVRVDVHRSTWWIDVDVIDPGTPGGLESPGDPPVIRIVHASTDHPTEPGWIHRSASSFGARWLERAEEAIVQNIDLTAPDMAQ